MRQNGAADAGEEEPEIWAAHLAVVEGESVGGVEFETDRARFLGRGRGVRTPISVLDGRPLSGSVGTVLDPIFSLRRRVRIAPGTTVQVLASTLSSFEAQAAASSKTDKELSDLKEAKATADKK